MLNPNLINFSLYNSINIFEPLFPWAYKIQIKQDTIELITLPKHLKKLLFFLKKHSTFTYNFLVDIVCSETPEDPMNLTLNYILLSKKYNQRLILTTQLDEAKIISTIYTVYPNANWIEREIWDLFGIIFNKHPDLRRILTDYGFKGHPLRKDFPLTGNLEVFYNHVSKLVDYRISEVFQQSKPPSENNFWLIQQEPLNLLEEEENKSN